MEQHRKKKRVRGFTLSFRMKSLTDVSIHRVFHVRWTKISKISVSEVKGYLPGVALLVVADVRKCAILTN